MYEIVKIEAKIGKKILRKKTADFDFTKFGKKEINDLIRNMREIMRKANGIGLSANQIGLDLNMFVAEVPDDKGGNKFYAVFNPKFEKLSSNKIAMEEGCLSVPATYGEVSRPERVTLVGLDKYQKPLKIKAWGLLARVFQHEVDHLNGKLFIDHTKKITHLAENE